MKKNILSDAIIRNANICKENENIIHYSKFDIERDLKGWDFIENASLYGVSGRLLFLHSSNGSTSISRSQGLVSFDSAYYNNITFKYKYTKAHKNTTASLGKIQFLTSADPIYSDEKSIQFDLNSDGKWHTYSLNMGKVSTWVGLITNIKIFFSINGTTDDIIYLEYIKISAPYFKVCMESCEVQNDITRYASNFSISDLNTQPFDFLISQSSIDRKVLIESNPDTLTDASLALINTNVSLLGPKITYQFNEFLNNGYFSCRVYVTNGKAIVKLLNNIISNYSSLELLFDSDLKIKYKNNLNVFSNFTVPISYELNNWIDIFILFNSSSSTNTVRINGTLADDKIPVIYSGRLEGFSIEVNSNNSKIFVDDLLVIENLDSTECTGIGKQGFIKGQSVTFTKLNIIKNYNDKIIVNINNYGDVIFILDPTNNLTKEELRSLLQIKLSSLDLGGYVNCLVQIKENSFIIKSGTYGFDSSVKLIPTVLSDELGFIINHQENGRPHAVDFNTLSTFKEKSYCLENLKQNTKNDLTSSFFVQNPEQPQIEIGSIFNDSVSRRVEVQGTGKTYIDFINRSTNEGLINEVYFHGVLPNATDVKLEGYNGYGQNKIFTLNNIDTTKVNIIKGDILTINTSGYVGNGSYVIDSIVGISLYLVGSVNLPAQSNLTYNISNTAKVKQFRPTLDGTLNLINEQIIGVQNNTDLYSRSPDTYKINVNWYLHKGDLIGIYNPTILYGGANDINLLESTYLEIEGEVISSVKSNVLPKGNNIFGIGLYGKSEKLQNLGVFDIEFPEENLLEDLIITGYQADEKRHYNILTAANNGLTVTATVSGTHKHRLENTFTGNIFTVTHQNVGYNLNALIDGSKYASNGIVGLFEQNSTKASYFYISGDGEWVDTNEFPSNILHLELSEFEEDPYSINFNWTTPIDISKIKIYFKEFPHSEAYYLEYYDPVKVNNPTQSKFYKIGYGEDFQYTKVKLDKTTLLKDNFNNNEALYRHFYNVYDGYLNNADLTAVIAYEFYRKFSYNTLDKEFDAVYTNAFKFVCFSHKSTKISEIELYGETEVNNNLEDSLEVYYAGKDNIFYKAEFEVIDNSVKFLINKPIKYIRLKTSPSNILNLTSILGYSTDDNIKYNINNSCKDVLNISSTMSGESPVYRVDVVNNTCSVADLEINIEDENFTNGILLKTKANALKDITLPDIGPPGILYKNENYPLYVTDNIAINATTYGLKNLAKNKKVYTGLSYQTESDSFILNFIDGSKWETLGTNYPQLGIALNTPGFKLIPDPGPTGEPSLPLFAILKSRWHVTGSFNARIIANSKTGTTAGAIGSFLGIIDDTGRMVYIISDKAQWSAASITRNWHHYRIIDTVNGEIDNELMYCLSGPTYCPNGITKDGELSDEIDYTLNIEYIDNPLANIKIIRFSYADSINGAKKGILEWANQDYYEIDINSLGLIGQLKVVIGHNWYKNGTATSAVAYSNIKHFYFGGNSSYSSNRVITFNSTPQITGLNGEINITNLALYPFQQTKTVAVDLENIVSLDIFKIYTNSNKPLWDSNRIQFSDSSTNDINQVIWGNTTQNKVRWLLFEETPVQTLSGLKYLDAIRIFPDITIPTLRPLEWQNLGNILTDSNLNTKLNQSDYPIIAIQLEEAFNISKYSIVNSNNLEFQRGSNFFNGWGNSSYYTTANTFQTDPNLVRWLNWNEYSEETKEARTAKWFAFKNYNFIPSSGMLNTPKYEIAQFTASTVNLSSKGFYNYTDRVDFTEYPAWFNSPLTELIDLAVIKDIDRNYNTILYNTSSGADTVLQEITFPLAVFDGDDNTYTVMSENTGYLWRVFGTASGIVTSGSQIFTNEDDTNFELITSSANPYILYNIENVKGFAFKVNENSECLPKTIYLQTLTGTNPNITTSWQTIYTETDLTTSGTSDDIFIFNNGNDYIHYFNTPIATSGLKLVISESYIKNSNTQSLSINYFKIFKDSSILNPILLKQSDYVNKVDGRRSLNLIYPTGTSGLAKVYGTFTINSDPLWSFQDYFSFYLKTDSSLIDWDTSYIKIGANSQQYYKWYLKDLDILNLNEFNLIKLKFKNADIQSNGELNLSTPSVADLEPTINFKTGPIEYLELGINVLNLTTSPINVWIDKFEIIREDFNIQGRYNKTLYLNNSEFIYFPIVDINLQEGFFEAIITPDWDKQGRLTYKSEEAFTIFTICNNLEESLSLFYHSRFGFKFVFTNNEDIKFNYNIGYINTIKPFKPFKLGISWSSYETSSLKNTANVIFYIEEEEVAIFKNPWFSKQTKTHNLIIGGIAPLSNVAFSSADYYSGSVATYILADVKSLTGGIENILYSRFSSNINFKDFINLKDQVQISLDNITFYPLNDQNIPFRLFNIGHNEVIPVYIKIDFPYNKENLIRDLFLTTKWTIKQ